MMRIFLAIYLLTLSADCRAQLQVQESEKRVTIGETKNGASLYYVVRGMDTTHVLMFRNAKYETIIDMKAVPFYNTGTLLDDLYSLLLSVINDDKYSDEKATVTVKLGISDIILSRITVSGKRSVMILCDGKWCYLTEKELNRLFNRN